MSVGFSDSITIISSVLREDQSSSQYLDNQDMDVRINSSEFVG
jgi:hypothetical protein